MDDETVETLLNSVRDLVHDVPWVGSAMASETPNTKWDQVTAAMDAVGDVELAIKAYKNREEVGYLEIYGLLQAMVVEQEAVDHMRRLLMKRGKIKWYRDYPELLEARIIRNETVGHPTEVRNNRDKEAPHAYCVISRSSINRGYFEYLRYEHDGTRHIPVHVARFIEAQQNGIAAILREIRDHLSRQLACHYEKFRGTRVLPVWESYPLERFDDLGSVEHEKAALSELDTVLRKVEHELTRRCGPLEVNVCFIGAPEMLDEFRSKLHRLRTFRSLTGVCSSPATINELRLVWLLLGKEVGYVDDEFNPSASG